MRLFKVIIPELLLAVATVLGVGGAVEAYYALHYGAMAVGIVSACIGGLGLIASGISWLVASERQCTWDARVEWRLGEESCDKCKKLKGDNERLLQRASEAEQALVKLRID